MWNRVLFIAVVLSLAGWNSGQVYAADDPQPDLTPEQQEAMAHFEASLTALEDQAFDQYARVADIQLAYHALDVNRLVDAALQLAHGERVLLRPHHSGLRPGALLEVAAEIAASQRNPEAFDRIDLAAKSAGADTVASKLAAFRKLASQARSTQVDFGTHDWISAMIEDARLLRDAGILDDVKADLPDDLTEEQRREALRLVGVTGEQIARSNPHPAIDKLTAPSRALYTAINKFYASPSAVKGGREVGFSYTCNLGALPYPYVAQIYSQHLGTSNFNLLPVHASFPNKQYGSTKERAANVSSVTNVKVIATVQINKNNTLFHTAFKHRWVKIYP